MSEKDTFEFQVFRLLRLLTPVSISKMTRESTGVEKVPLTSLMSDEKKSETDPAEQEQGKEKEYEFCELKLIKNDEDLESNEGGEAAEVVDEEEKEGAEEDESSASVFILEERRKLKESQRELQKKGVEASYQRASGMDITPPSKDGQKKKIVTSLGTLINKRQT